MDTIKWDDRRHCEYSDCCFFPRDLRHKPVAEIFLHVHH